MKLRSALKDAFSKPPPTPDIKAFLREQRNELGGEGFSHTFFNMFRGRRYNQFVDYGAMALKLTKLINSLDYSIDPSDHDRSFASLIVEKLLFDDRHDCYQNVPYIIADFIKVNQDVFWLSVSNILIDSFNENGTGDIVWQKCPHGTE